VAEAALKDLKDLKDLTDRLRSILQMSKNELKTLCEEKDILKKGGATLKHKYAFALFSDALLNG
jgi:hypothetical protein